MKSYSVTIQMKATKQYFQVYFPVVLFITLYKVVLTFESVDETGAPNVSFLLKTMKALLGSTKYF